jgi:hypothetical protein
MMQVVYTVCALADPGACETRVLTFSPRLPVACIFAAGPELEAVLAEDERVVAWSCAEATEVAHEED